jgi:predicted transcriptional regulator
MTKSKRQRIVEQIADIASARRLQPGEFTVRHYADARRLSRRSAARELEKLMAAGYVTRRQVNHDGNRCWAYTPKADEGTGKTEDGAPKGE